MEGGRFSSEIWNRGDEGSEPSEVTVPVASRIRRDATNSDMAHLFGPSPAHACGVMKRDSPRRREAPLPPSRRGSSLGACLNAARAGKDSFRSSRYDV